MKKRNKLISALSLLLAASMLFTACKPGDGSKDDSSKGTEIKHKITIMGKSPNNDWFKWADRGEFPAWKQFDKDMAELGIEPNFQLVMADQYDITIQTRFADPNSLPDLMNLYGYKDTSIFNLGRSGLVYDVKDLIAKYSKGAIMDRYNKYGDFAFDAATAPDGKTYWLNTARTYTYLQEDGTTIPAPMMIGMGIRKDWLDKCGLKMPTTWDEYVNALVEFRKKDANGNKKQDEIMLVDNYMFDLWYSTIGQLFGLVPNHVYPGDDGKVVTPWEQPGLVPYLNAMKTLIDKGVIDKTTIGANDTQQAELMAQNRISTLRQYDKNLIWENMIQATDEEKGKALFLNVGALQADPKITPYLLCDSAEMTLSRFVIPTYAKDPEGVIKYLDYMFGDRGTAVYYSGIKDVDYKEQTDPLNIETSWYYGADKTWHQRSDLDKKGADGKEQFPAMKDEERYKLRFGFAASKWLANFTPEAFSSPLQFVSKDERAKQKEATQIKNMKYEHKYMNATGRDLKFAYASKAESDRLAKIEAAFVTAQSELHMKLILGTVPMADLDKEIKVLKEKFFMDEIVKIYQDRYDRSQKAAKQ